MLIALAEADSNVAHILRVHFSFVERLRAGFDADHRERWIGLVNEGKIFGNAISEQNDRQVDVGGASATQSAANLDRHWRNIRTISTHNPTINKASAVGDFFVNGTPPPRNGFF